MSNARDLILGRIRTSLRDVPVGEEPLQIPRLYRHTDDSSPDELVARFAERVREYKANVRIMAEDELPSAIGAACGARGVQRLVVPPDLPEAWLSHVPEAQPDRGLSYAELDTSDGVLTGCALGIAQTGTIVLDGGPRQGRRAISLLPDYHLCVVFADQIVGLVPEAITRLLNFPHGGRSPITFISGPSATSDIELNRVEGVHGPRTLEVLIVTAGQ